LCFSDVVLHYEGSEHSYQDQFRPGEAPWWLPEAERDPHWFMKKFEEASQNIESGCRYIPRSRAFDPWSGSLSR